jgi:phosphohistidine phosphatase
MKLLIIRHGKAYDADSQRWPDDSERPLTKKGQRRFARSVPAIKALVKDAPRVISSPYERALRTAQILCEGAGWGEPEIDARLSAHFGPDDALDLLKSLDASGTYAIVGHDPTFSFLPGCLIGADRIGATALKTGAVALVDTGMAPAVPGAGTLKVLMQPKSLAR